jgi:hypothetical protein
LIHFIVSATAIVAIHRSGVGVSPALKAELVLSEVLEVLILKAQLRVASLPFEDRTPLLVKPPLLILLIAVLLKALLLSHLLLTLSVLREA